MLIDRQLFCNNCSHYHELPFSERSCFLTSHLSATPSITELRFSRNFCVLNNWGQKTSSQQCSAPRVTHNILTENNKAAAGTSISQCTWVETTLKSELRQEANHQLPCDFFLCDMQSFCFFLGCFASKAKKRKKLHREKKISSPTSICKLAQIRKRSEHSNVVAAITTR